MYNPFSLESKTILVTGASSGIGRAIAIECSKIGATVIITGRNGERLSQTFNKLEGKCHRQIIADLNSDTDISNLIDELPLLNGVVHSAGLATLLPFQFLNSDKLTSLMNINFNVPTIISSMLVKKKKCVKGSSFVFISSIDGPKVTHMGNSVYGASKSAITAISKGMALELASKKIRVNCIQPGMTETPLIHNESITQEQLDEDMKTYPLGRYAKPEEIAYAAIYLLSDASAFTTGTDICIDGGYTLI